MRPSEAERARRAEALQGILRGLELEVPAACERCDALGGEDPLLLTVDPEPGPGGTVRGSYGPPGGRALRPRDQHIFSFEPIGPLRCSVELARTVVVGEPDELALRMNAAVSAGLEAGRERMAPGARRDDVPRAILEAVSAHGARSTYRSGHGLGQDVIEEPWPGLEVVRDGDAVSTRELEEGMALSDHPSVVDLEERAMGSVADPYIVRPSGGEVLPGKPRGLYAVA